MKNAGKLVLGILVLGSLTLTSCSKDGCTDPEAINYSSSANSDDGTCSYQASTTFWKNQQTASSLLNDGVTKLIYYVDYQKVGESDADTYWTGQPTCGTPDAVTAEISLIDPSESHAYSVEDQDGNELWKGTLDLKANVCLSTELVY